MKKFLIKFLITILVIVVLLAIAVVVLLNLTPNQLGIDGDSIDIMGLSLSDLELGDTKIIDIIKGIKNVGKVNESDIVTNAYTEETEKSTATQNTACSSLANQDNYASIITENVTYDKEYLREYKDTTIAYMLNNAIQNSTSEDEAFEALKDANLSIKELTINKDENTVRVVCFADLGSFKEEINSTLGAASSIVSVPDGVYIVSTLNIASIDANGKLVLTSNDVCLNGNNDDPVSKAIMKVILKAIGDDENDASSINDKIGDALATVISHLGKIGIATEIDQTTGEILNNTDTISINGVQNGKITVITYTETK